MENIKAILFDWDGTLVDTCQLVLDAHNHVRQKMGLIPWSMNDFLSGGSKSTREYYPEIYGERAEQAEEILYTYVEANHLDYLKEMPEAQALLKSIAVPMGVVSNKRHHTLVKEVKALGWESFFETIVGAGRAEQDKPSPKPIEMAREELSIRVSNHEILYVGDTETDLKCSDNAGCQSCLIQNGKRAEDLKQQYTPELSFMSIRAFKNHLWNCTNTNIIRMAEKKAC